MQECVGENIREQQTRQMHDNKVDVVTNFIKDEVESSSDAEVFIDGYNDLNKIGSLCLDKMCVTCNKILAE